MVGRLVERHVVPQLSQLVIDYALPSLQTCLYVCIYVFVFCFLYVCMYVCMYVCVSPYKQPPFSLTCEGNIAILRLWYIYVVCRMSYVVCHLWSYVVRGCRMYVGMWVCGIWISGYVDIV